MTENNCLEKEGYRVIMSLLECRYQYVSGMVWRSFSHFSHLSCFICKSLHELILYYVTQGGPPSSAYEKEEGEGMKNGWRSEKEEQENNNNTEKNKNNGRALSPGLETLQQTLYNHGKHEMSCTQRNVLCMWKDICTAYFLSLFDGL
jgi:hypothetical protein